VLSAAPLLSPEELEHFSQGLTPGWDGECDVALKAAVSRLAHRAEPKGHVVLILDKVGSFTFTFRAFGTLFYSKRLTKSKFVERGDNISLWYIKIRIEQDSSIHSYKANGTSFIITRLPA